MLSPASPPAKPKRGGLSCAGTAVGTVRAACAPAGTPAIVAERCAAAAAREAEGRGTESGAGGACLSAALACDATDAAGCPKPPCCCSGSGVATAAANRESSGAEGAVLPWNDAAVLCFAEFERKAPPPLRAAGGELPMWKAGGAAAPDAAAVGAAGTGPEVALLLGWGLDPWGFTSIDCVRAAPSAPAPAPLLKLSEAGSTVAAPAVLVRVWRGEWPWWWPFA